MCVVYHLFSITEVMYPVTITHQLQHLREREEGERTRERGRERERERGGGGGVKKIHS